MPLSTSKHHISRQRKSRRFQSLWSGIARRRYHPDQYSNSSVRLFSFVPAFFAGRETPSNCQLSYFDSRSWLPCDAYVPSIVRFSSPYCSSRSFSSFGATCLYSWLESASWESWIRRARICQNALVSLSGSLPPPSSTGSHSPLSLRSSHGSTGFCRPRDTATTAAAAFAADRPKRLLLPHVRDMWSAGDIRDTPPGFLSFSSAS